MADDLGYADVSCYGRPDLSTPNVDRLAAGGVRFLQAYANSAVCSATRTALITGRYQYRLPIGLEEPLAGRDVGLPPAHPTLPSLLKKAGYGTTLVGKWHLGVLPKFGPLRSGYEHFYGFRTGAVDYYTHAAGSRIAEVPNGRLDDLWDDDVPVHESGVIAKGIVIGDHVWLGTGCRVLDGVQIGRHAIVGAGSVVTHSVPEHATVVGVPARLLAR